MSLDYFAIKVGDTDPPFDVTLQGIIDDVEVPSSLADVTDLRVSYRRRAGDEPLLTKDAEIYAPSDQDEGDPHRGRIQHGWLEGEVLLLFGEPEDPTTTIVILQAEVEGMRNGKRVSWPSEGYIPIRVWRDIVEDES